MSWVAIIKVEILWMEEAPEIDPMIELVLIEEGQLEERSVVQSSRALVSSDVCELLHWLIGSSTLASDGASGPPAVTRGSGVLGS